MSGRFFDSNVPLYLLSPDSDKAAIAEGLLVGGGTISVQVLNEIANVARRKLRLEWTAIQRFFADLDVLVEVVPLNRATHDSGLRLAARYGLAVYDAMIVAAALEAKCDVLYSEDMHDGLWVDDRLRIVNPFG